MNWQIGIYLALAVIIGGLGGIHVPINGALGARIQSALVATFTFYGVGFFLIGMVCLVTWDRNAFVALLEVPRWYFVAGMISVIVVGTSTYLIPRIGAVNLFVIVVASQMMVRMAISHFGWLESPISPISWVKIAGGIMLIGGAVLVVKD